MTKIKRMMVQKEDDDGDIDGDGGNGSGTKLVAVTQPYIRAVTTTRPAWMR